MVMQSLRWVLVVATTAALAAGCASPDAEEAATEVAALNDDEPAMGLLLSCEDAEKTQAELSIEKASDGSRITLVVHPLNSFFSIEYRGSDVRAVGDLGAGRAVSVPAQLLSEFGRRDRITVRPSGSTAKLTLESAQHGSRDFSCFYVD